MLRRLAATTLLCVGLSTAPAFAQLPDAPTLLADLGLGADEIAQVQGGAIVHHTVVPASDRDLTTGLAFEVKTPPSALVAQMKKDLLDRVDPNVTAHGTISNPATAADFQKLTLSPAVAKQYPTATPGGGLSSALSLYNHSGWGSRSNNYVHHNLFQGAGEAGLLPGETGGPVYCVYWGSESDPEANPMTNCRLENNTFRKVTGSTSSVHNDSADIVKWTGFVHGSAGNTCSGNTYEDDGLPVQGNEA